MNDREKLRAIKEMVRRLEDGIRENERAEAGEAGCKLGHINWGRFLGDVAATIDN